MSTEKKHTTDEEEINAIFFPFISELGKKHYAASQASQSAHEAYVRTKRETPEKSETWHAYLIARQTRIAAEVAFNAVLDARADAKKKLKTAKRKYWFNS